MKVVSNGKSIEVPSCGALDIYSTEEQVVGRWIDGRPVYRKSGTGVSPSEVDKWGLMFSVPDVKDVIYFSASLINEPNDIVIIPNNNIMTAYWLGGASILVSLTAFTNKTVIATISYTKTTDQATIELPAAMTSAPAQLNCAAAPASAASAELTAGIGNEEV